MNVLAQAAVEERRAVNEGGFTQLLQWLDDGIESNGETYLEMRRRLVSYFDRRNRPFADDLADETLSRIAMTLQKAGAIAVRPPAKYCYVVAKFVLHEDIRRGRRSIQVDEARIRTSGDSRSTMPDAGREVPLAERRLACLERCLERLKPEQRSLAIEYYRDSKRQKIDRRRDLAKNLGITMNALGIRACRIRNVLEQCVGDCCK